MIFNNSGINPELIAKSNFAKIIVLDEQLFDKIIRNGEKR